MRTVIEWTSALDRDPPKNGVYPVLVRGDVESLYFMAGQWLKPNGSYSPISVPRGYVSHFALPGDVITERA